MKGEGCVAALLLIVLGLGLGVGLAAAAVYSGYSAYVSFEEGRMTAAFWWAVGCLLVLGGLFGGATRSGS